MQTLELIAQHKVIAIVRLDDLSAAEALTRALVEGGVRVLEFTLTNPDALRVVEALRQTFAGQVCLGVGSVVNPDQARAAVAHDAQFMVAPILRAEVIQVGQAAGIPVIPGAFTPTEIQTAWELGASAVKVFPARGLGASYIRDVLAPLPHLKLVPTGGIDAANAWDYLRAGAFAVGVGGRLVDAGAVRRQDWQAIRLAAQELVTACQTAS